MESKEGAEAVSEIYRERIIDHYKNPRNSGSLKSPDIVAKDVNPGCGDEFEIHIKLDKQKIKDIKFSGIGCVISTASASMLTEFVKGKTLDDVAKMEKDDVVKLLGIELSPARLKCALLPLMIIREGVKNYKK